MAPKSVRVTTSITIPRPIEEVFAHLAKIENLTEFIGYGPIPGIREAHWEEGSAARVGAIRRVTNVDGSSHREEVMVFDPPHALVDRIFDIDSPLKHLAADVRDSFLLSPHTDGTRVERSFEVEPKNAVARVAVLGLAKAALRPALDRHLLGLAKALG